MCRNYLLVNALLLTSILVTSSYAAAPENLSCAKNSVINYYQSGDYEKAVKKVVMNAEKYMQKRTTGNQYNIKSKKLAIVLDIDDTSLSNFSALKQEDFSLRHLDTIQKKANAPAIRPILQLYNDAIHAKITVFFISNRPNELRSVTISNLHRAGYESWTQLYLPRPNEESHSYKTQVRQILTAQGYDIIINIGDQYTDLEGGYADHTYKIPNLMYSTEKVCRTSK